MKTIEATGKTIEAAVVSGIKELGITLDDAEVRVLKHPGLFSKARVSVTALGQFEDKLDTATPESLISKIEKRAVSHSPQQAAGYGGGKNVPPSGAREQQQSQPAQQRDKWKAQSQQAAPQQNNPAAQNRFQKPQPPQASPKDAAMPAPAVWPDNKQQPRSWQQTNGQQPQNRAREPQPQQPRNELPKIDRAALDAAITGAEKYLTNVLKLMSIDGSLKSTVNGDEADIEIITGNPSVIGYRGETLDALEHLTTASIGAEGRIRINLDSSGFREKRNASLIELAKRLADKAVKTGKKVNLEPMNSLSRKVIHSALAQNDQVITRSEGHEPNRYLVIIPKRSNSDNRQLGYGKNNRHGRGRNGKADGGGKSEE